MCKVGLVYFKVQESYTISVGLLFTYIQKKVFFSE